MAKQRFNPLTLLRMAGGIFMSDFRNFDQVKFRMVQSLEIFYKFMFSPQNALELYHVKGFDELKLF